MKWYAYNIATNSRITPEIQSGVALYRSALPAQWALELDPESIPGHTVKFDSLIDAQPSQTLQQPPYIVNHRGALNLSNGSHTVRVSINNVRLADFAFTLGDAPPAPTPTAVIAFGTNMVGCDYPSGDPKLHPEIPAALKSVGMTWVRLWLEIPELQRVGDAYWTICRAWEALGFHVAVEIQFPNKQPFGDNGLSVANQLAAANKSPAGKAISAIIWGNEINTKGASTDDGVYLIPGNYISPMVDQGKVVTPICRAANIISVAPSILNDEGAFTSAAPKFSAVYDALDFHLYSNDPKSSIDKAARVANVAAANKSPLWMSEFSMDHSGGDTTAQWLAKQMQFVEGIKAMPVAVAMQFAAFPTNHREDPISLLDAKYQPSALQSYQTILK